MMSHGSSRRIANNLVALSSAAVLTVYSAGYLKTRAAAERLENAEHRDATDRPALRAPAPEVTAPPVSVETPPPQTQSVPVPVAEPEAAEPKASVPSAPAVRPEPARKAPVVVPPPAEPTPISTPIPPPVAAPVTTPVETTAAAVPVVTPATIATTPPPDTDAKPAEPPAPKYKDGTYYGWGTSRHGSIQASVTIENGKIASSSITQCLTRYSCSVIAHLVPQVAARQSTNIDYVSGATQSSDAFYDAVVEALSKAK